MAKKKILAFSTIRSDYDLMSSLFRMLNEEEEIELKLLVSGAHMSPTFGKSVKQIEKDGLDILLRLETLIDSDSKVSRIKTASLMLQNSIDIIAQYSPDLMIYAGDREDVLIASMIGGYLEIPTIHFFGGDHTVDGHIDNSIRHATSKLSSIHMVSTAEHKDRLLHMGENKSRIYPIGSIALDKFCESKQLSLEEIQNTMELPKDFKDFALVIFHPGVDEKDVSGDILTDILQSLLDRNIKSFVSAPNTDPGNRRIFEAMKKFDGNSNFCFYKNLDRELFISIYKQSQFIMGNSSSGITEAASIPIPAINVGSRQRGRMAGENVVFVGTNKSEISSALDLITSDSFQEKMVGFTNPYGDGKSTQRAFELIKTKDFGEYLFKTEDALTVLT